MSAKPSDPALTARIVATFGSEQPRLRLFARAAAAVMAAAIAGYAIWVVARVNWPGFAGEAIKSDFTAFWAAAKLALAGKATAAFDPVRLEAAMALPPDAEAGSMLWLYPPAWHMAVAPLGFLPFSAAFVLYSLIAFTAFAVAIRPLAQPLPGGMPLMLAGPSVILTLQAGNNSLLWAAALVAALAALMRGRQTAAGGFIALLTLKPQLGLLVSVALVAGGQWRAIGWATAGGLAIAALATLVMGFGYWLLWFETLRGMSGVMGGELVRFYLMITWYALARFLGAGHEAAFLLQLALTLAAAAAVAWVWRRPVTSDLKAAALCVAVPLATPYAYHYEMTLGLVAAMFLARDGFGRSAGARAWLLLLWLGQVPGLALQPYLPPALYAAPLLTATLGLCVWRAAGPARSPSQATARGTPTSTCS